MPSSNAVLLDESQLARELANSRANEEASKAALHQLHKDLNAAYLKIARQDQKLEVLAKKLRLDRDANDAVSTSGIDHEFVPSRLADLANPHNLCRAFAQRTSWNATLSSIRLRATSPQAAARIDSLWRKLPDWTRGVISAEDAGFLDGLINDVRPDQVYEIGVASGASSAIILSSMAAYADPARIWLHSYDIATACYFDPARAVGEATRLMVPELLEQWKRNTRCTALDVPREKDPESKSLYFIDANHSHPWPALDLVALLPDLKPGDHIVLHDINLPTVTEGKFLDFGAQWLFDDWLGERLRPDVALPNIGAVIIPEDKQVILSSVVKTLSRSWPTGVKVEEDHLHACDQALTKFLQKNSMA